MEEKETTVNIYPIIDSESPFNDSVLPVIKEEELEDSFSRDDLIARDKTDLYYELKIIEKFIYQTKNYLNINLKKLNNNTWENEKFLVKYFDINKFTVIEHTENYLSQDSFIIMDKIDFNLIVSKLER